MVISIVEESAVAGVMLFLLLYPEQILDFLVKVAVLADSLLRCHRAGCSGLCWAFGGRLGAGSLGSSS